MNTQEIMNILWLIFEIIGTVAFAISGALLAVEKENDIFGVLFLGVTTAVGGGIIRDILVREIPSVLCKRVYAVASLIGGLFYYFLVKLGISAGIANFIGAASIFIIRMLASKFRWDLPKVDLDK